MNLFLKFSAMAIFLHFSAAWAGSKVDDTPMTRDSYLSGFYNPNLPIQPNVNDILIKNLLTESNLYDHTHRMNSHTYPWKGDLSFRETLNIELDRNERENIELESNHPLSYSGWSRCETDHAQNSVLELVRLVGADKSLTDQDVKDIVMARLDIAFTCEEDKFIAPTFNASTGSKKIWKDYLTALAYWYNEQYESAANVFSTIALGEGEIAELASYMAGRGFLRSAQENWQPWNDIEAGVISESDIQNPAYWFNKHYQAGGVYASSALGLMRRVAYLKGDSDTYLNYLEEHLHKELLEKNTPLITEIVREYIQYGYADELMFQLQKGAQTSAELATQLKPIYDFIEADRLYRNGQKQQAVNVFITLPYTAGFTYVMEYADENNDVPLQFKAINKWLDGNTKDFYLTEMNSRTQGVSVFFTSENDKLFNHVVNNYCSADGLQLAIIDNLDTPHIQNALYRLFRSRIQQDEFKQLNDLFSNPNISLGKYIAIKNDVENIALGLELGTSYMNVGMFMDKEEGYIYGSPISERLKQKHAGIFCSGGADTGNIRNNAIGPQYLYLKSLKYFETLELESEAQAQALSLMINCDRWGEDGCFGDRPEEAPSAKELFIKLHKNYRDSQWAKSTPYYY